MHPFTLFEPEQGSAWPTSMGSRVPSGPSPRGVGARSWARAGRSGLLALAALVLAGCGRSAGPDEGIASAQIGGWLSAVQASGPVAHHGTRRVEFHWEGAQGPASFAYLEEVKVASSGAYAIETVQPLTPVGMDIGQFLLLQQARAGFFYRYRDAAIRDAGLVHQNYQLSAIDPDVVVAGRSATHVVLARTVGESLRHHLALDNETGVVLASRTYDAGGALLSRVEFESIAFENPPPFQSHVASNQEVVVPVGPELDLALGFPAVLPALLPDGYQLVETARIVDPFDRVWLKATYGDGVDVTFFLVRPSSESLSSTAPGMSSLTTSGFMQASGSVGSPRNAGTAPARGDEPAASDPVLLAFRAAGIQVLQCDHGGLDIIVVGRPSFSDLQWMVESVYF